jgi:hypothetical protein
MKLKMETILAITTTINGNQVFVKSFSTRQDDKYIPNYTGDKHLAHDFETEVNALLHIDRIINYNNYRFELVILDVAEDTKLYIKHKSPNTAA